MHVMIIIWTVGTIKIPFTEEMHGVVLKEARRKGIQPEVLLKVWILERVKSEVEPGVDAIGREGQNIDTLDLLSLPLRFCYMLMASATATISTLADEISSRR